LGPDTEFSYLELEIVHNSAGLRFYVNLLLLEAPSLKDDPSRTTLTIEWEDQEPWTINPFLLGGGQKLLIPGNIADVLIEKLLDGKTFTIRLGRSYICVISDAFRDKLECLLK